MTFTGNQPRYSVGTHQTSVPANRLAHLSVTGIPGGQTASPSQSGLLLLHRDAKAGAEAQGVRIVR